MNFNIHLHIVAGRVGLDRAGTRLVKNIKYYADEVTKRWRHTLVDYLVRAIDAGQVQSDIPLEQLRDRVQEQYDVWWKPMVRNHSNLQACLRYIARYLRRPPIAEYRILPSPVGSVHFIYKDKKPTR